MSAWQTTPAQAARLLRAKGAELEAAVLAAGEQLRPIDEARADIALVAQLLADEIERTAELRAVVRHPQGGAS